MRVRDITPALSDAYQSGSGPCPRGIASHRIEAGRCILWEFYSASEGLSAISFVDLRWSRRALTWLGALLLVSSIRAQTPADSPTATIKSSVRLAQVDVIAKDKHGNPIPGLRQKTSPSWTMESRRRLAICRSSAPNFPLVAKRLFRGQRTMRRQRPSRIAIRKMPFQALFFSTF